MVTIWNVPADQIQCAWAGCDATFEGNMPPGWQWLLAYWRDAQLCPKHAAALERLLKELPWQLVDGPSAGNA
jgi:hypothetical protein